MKPGSRGLITEAPCQAKKCASKKMTFHKNVVYRHGLHGFEWLAMAFLACCHFVHSADLARAVSTDMVFLA